ncbi:MAG TPA: replication-associated recombination protein A, partial [Candidatus Gracilibacteria bacterium]|nr:replication-associated recombination protein A [Candidatus Gracilibacteria bacterium]
AQKVLDILKKDMPSLKNLLASALIKSIRGSDADAGIYYLARMLKGGEDPRFIARRLWILSAEDVGLGDPQALVLATSVYQASEKLGMPEIRIPLAELVVYLARAPKNNSAYLAIDEALAEVDQSGPLPVPLHLRNATTNLMKELDYGKNYQYAHDCVDKKPSHAHLPEKLVGRKFVK